PYHWAVGKDAVVSGDAANDLLGITLDPNVQIQNFKTGSCDIRPGRRPRGAERIALIEEYQERAGLTVRTGNERITDPQRELNEDPKRPHGEGQSAGRSTARGAGTAVREREEDE
ncbi:hypothetical protein K1Y78_55280, partial [Streptomyces sp. tea 10]|nr:hypothetical protein [Streptomyces sp. tea 10]